MPLAADIARSAPPSLIVRRLIAFALACLGVFGLDALAFRTRWYPQLLQPDSTTGLFEMVLWRERQAQKRYGDNLVVTVGDSRFGLAPKLSNETNPPPNYMLRSAGVAGTSVRDWYYMLRDLDPSANRYRAVVFGINSYDDEDEAFEPDDDVRSLHYAIARLRVTDAIDFAFSFHSWELRWEAFRGSLFKGLVYQTDLREFLSNPKKRIRLARFNRSGFEEWTYNYLGTERSMAGLEIDWSALKAAFPPGADDNQRGTTENFLLYRPGPQTGRLAAFRRQWFGRILDRYRNSRTKIIFLRLPRGPIPRPDFLSRAKSSSIRELAARPNALLCDEHAFDSLEHPELFGDGMHLNRAGVAKFSPMLAKLVAQMLGAPGQAPGEAPGKAPGQAQR
jgi:hypothetical protein